MRFNGRWLLLLFFKGAAAASASLPSPSLVFIELLKTPLGVPMAAATVHPQRSHFGWADGWTSSHSFLQLQSPKTAKNTIMTQTHEKLSM